MHDPLVGQQLNDFKVLERIGKGGMATVYRAYQPSVNRDVALKVIALNKESAEDSFRRRFAQEAEMIAALEHIHVLPIYDYGIVGETAYLAMRLLRGGSLGDLLRKGALPIDRAARLFTQVAEGLAHAHQKGIIHRDLKPTNILLDDAGNAYLTDFGLAKLVEQSAELTKSGSIVGTPSYMSPEQLRGDPLDHRSDIYSLGVILYQMLTGKQPFESSDVVSVIYKHLEEAPRPPTALNPDIPPAIEAIILTALAKNRDERYQSVQEMVEDLKAAAVGTSTLRLTGRRRTAPLLTPRRGLTRWQWILALALGLALPLLVLLNAVLPSLLSAPTPRAASVIAGGVGSVTDYLPTDADAAAARARVGTGFVAYMALTLDTAYHAAQAREVMALLNDFGIPVEVFNAERDSYTQVTQLEAARARGAAGIILGPLDSPGLTASLTAIQDDLLPLVQFTGTPPGYGGVLLSGDDYLMGVRAGRYAGQFILTQRGGQANVAILNYPDLPQIVEREQGIVDGLLALAPDAQIVARGVGGTPDLGRTAVQAWLSDGVQFDVIVSINDAGAFGAVDALTAAGIDPAAVAIVGVDAEPRAREYILDGTYFIGSVDIDRQQFSQAAAYAMVRLLAGTTIVETLLVPPGEVLTRDALLAQATPDATAAP